MQTDYKNENEEYRSKETNLVDIIIYIERVSKYMKEEYIREFGSRKVEI